MRYLALLLTATTLIVSPARAAESLTADDVLTMVALIPAPNGRPGGYERAPDARRIADAIAATADGSLLGTPREDASLMAVFASYESGNRVCPAGDGGKALGAWQLHYAGREVACDPARAARWWLAVARASVRLCADNPPDERLAALAGGTCARGRRLSATRVRLAREIASR